MAQFDSSAPFSHHNERDVAQVTQGYALSFEEEILQYRQPQTEQLGKSTGPIYDIYGIPATPTRPTTATPMTPVRSTIPANPSLVTALRSTIQPTATTRARITVIPGAKKTTPLSQDISTSKRRLHPQLRLGILMGMMLMMFCITLLSLSPLSDRQNGGAFFLGALDGAQAKQYVWSVPSHDATQPQSSTTNMNGANTAGGTGGTGAPAVPPPTYLPESQYVAIAQQDAIAAGISPDYFVRQINQESGFNPNAYSPAGAIGIAQFIPSTAAGLGINPYDPVQSLRGAANLMGSYARQYGGDYAKALAAYNAGGGTVNSAVNACGTSWLNCLPGETRNYIHVIMGI